MSASSSIEELQTALNTYNSNFAQITAALKEAPENADLLKLKSDLVEVIALTESLLKAKRKPTGTPVASVAAEISSQVQSKEKKSRPAPPPEEDEDDQHEDKTPGEFVVPRKLRIIPTDTEEEREHKRKRVKALKAQFRKKQQAGGELPERTTAWQQFTNKKQKVGFTERKKESIFKSPDSINGRVGVTGSGKGVTQQKAIKSGGCRHS